jgi:hypothetical protein
MSGRAARAAKKRKLNPAPKGFTAEEFWESYKQHGYYTIHSPTLIWMDWDEFTKKES